MITIAVELSDELAKKVLPWQDRLPEVIELGLRQLGVGSGSLSDDGGPDVKQKTLEALGSTGIVTLPKAKTKRARRAPIYAGGPPASEMIIAERRRDYEAC